MERKYVLLNESNKSKCFASTGGFRGRNITRRVYESVVNCKKMQKEAQSDGWMEYIYV